MSSETKIVKKKQHITDVILYTGSNDDKILEQLKKLYEEGWINIENSIIRSEFWSNNYKEMIQNWIDVYGKYDNEIKDQLKLHRNLNSVNSNSIVIQKFGDIPLNSDEFDSYIKSRRQIDQNLEYNQTIISSCHHLFSFFFINRDCLFNCSFLNV